MSRSLRLRRLLLLLAQQSVHPFMRLFYLAAFNPAPCLPLRALALAD